MVFLGHKVNREGVTPNPAKLEEVSNWEAPGSKKDLESFLGLAGYYREYVKDFAKISAPLHALTGAKVPFIWGEVEKEAFQLLKKRLTLSYRISSVSVSKRRGRLYIRHRRIGESNWGCAFTSSRWSREGGWLWELFFKCSPTKLLCNSKRVIGCGYIHKILQALFTWE